jgi:hypothetical protein
MPIEADATPHAEAAGFQSIDYFVDVGDSLHSQVRLFQFLQDCMSMSTA